MGSDLYKVKVVEKQDRTARLRVEVVHPDSNYLSDNESFALMILHESTRDTKAPLAQEISFDDTMDRGWLGLYTRGFIERVESKVDSGSSDGQTPADWIKGTLTITVTDPAWISHLVPGAEFDSRAFDMTSDFDDCAPIRPGQVDPNAPVPEAFISVPGSLWNDAKLPKVMRVAAYSSSGYRMVAERKGTLSAADLKDLDGQVVLHRGPYDDAHRISTVHIDGESVRFFSASEGGYGNSSSAPFEGSVGKAELVPGKRLGSRLKLSRLLGNLKPSVVSTKVEGDAAIARIGIPPGNTSFEGLTEDQLPALGFQLLINPVFPTDPFGDEKMLKPCPLSWTVEREVVRLFPAEERQLTQYINNQSVPVGDSLPQQYALAQRLSRGFIAKTEVVSQAAASTGALDALTEAQQKEALLAPWPELTVKVTPHHAVYLQHLSAPMGPLNLDNVSEAQPWEGAPATPATGPTGFGKKVAPPPQAAAPSSSYSSPAPASSGGPPKALKIVGIGCGVLVGLFLFCLVLGAIFGK
jgi:hypothetical protein